MPRFSNSEKTDMVLLLGECHGNSRAAVELYQVRYPDRIKPSHKNIMKIVTNLREEGSFVRKTRAKRKYRIVGNEGREADVLAMAHANPHISSRAVAAEVDFSHRTVLSIWHRNKYHPFKIHLHHALRPTDNHRRIEFSVCMQWKISETPEFLTCILWSEESTFHRNGTVNRHNMHYWSQVNPHWLGHRFHQIRWKTNVWAGILGDRIIGPFFFDENITGEVYLNFLRNELAPTLSELPNELTTNIWFQQDGASPHYANTVRDCLDEMFPNRWIGRKGPFPWPARSPDLTPMDFFLWGYVKSQVYETEPENIADLQGRIRQAMASITPAMLVAVRRSLTRRLADCQSEDGGHIEHLY